jgi:hypothetical protein
MAGTSVPHYRFGANRSFLNQEVELQEISFTLSRTGLKKKTGRTEITHLGNVSAGEGFPIHPQILGD